VWGADEAPTPEVTRRGRLQPPHERVEIKFTHFALEKVPSIDFYAVGIRVYERGVCVGRRSRFVYLYDRPQVSAALHIKSRIAGHFTNKSMIQKQKCQKLGHDTKDFT
jgi:hypothetical protein